MLSLVVSVGTTHILAKYTWSGKGANQWDIGRQHSFIIADALKLLSSVRTCFGEAASGSIQDHWSPPNPQARSMCAWQLRYSLLCESFINHHI